MTYSNKVRILEKWAKQAGVPAGGHISPYVITEQFAEKLGIVLTGKSPRGRFECMILHLLEKHYPEYSTLASKILAGADAAEIEQSEPSESGRRKTGNLDDFYRSWEWRRCRMRVLKARGARCECCGATTEDVDINCKPVRIVVDHIKPLRKFWSLRLDESNLQILCDECNMGKGSWDQTDWRSESAILAL